MASIHHPEGITVEIVGLEQTNNGRSCEQHSACGFSLEEDDVIRLRKVQVLDEHGYEESAIAAFRVSDGIDSCRVGFLPRNHVKHWKIYEGVLCQVLEIYSETSESASCRREYYQNHGYCKAALISIESSCDSSDNTTPKVDNKKKSNKTPIPMILNQIKKEK